MMRIPVTLAIPKVFSSSATSRSKFHFVQFMNTFQTNDIPNSLKCTLCLVTNWKMLCWLDAGTQQLEVNECERVWPSPPRSYQAWHLMSRSVIAVHREAVGAFLCCPLLSSSLSQVGTPPDPSPCWAPQSWRCTSAHRRTRTAPGSSSSWSLGPDRPRPPLGSAGTVSRWWTGRSTDRLHSPQRRRIRPSLELQHTRSDITFLNWSCNKNAEKPG